MSYSYSNPSSYADYHGGSARRGHRDSDATLTDYHPMESPEFIYHGPDCDCDQRERESEYNYGYDPAGEPYYDYRPSQSYENQSSYVSRYLDSSNTYSGNSQYQPSPLKQESSRYYADLYGNDYSGYTDKQDNDHRRDTKQKRRSVRFDADDNYEHSSSSSLSPFRRNQRGDAYSPSYDPRYSEMVKNEPEYDQYDDDYGYIQDDDEYDYRNTSAPSRSLRNDHEEYGDETLPGLPQPVTAPQFSTNSIPHGLLPFMFPHKEKKVPLTKRIKQAFKAMTANPDEVTLGCKAGRPTPQHIAVKDAEEEKVIEEERRQEEQRRMKEQERLIRLRRPGSSKSRIAEERERQSQAQRQSRPRETRRGPSYDMRLAEYARERARLREYDDAYNYRRSGQDPRYEYAD